MTIVISFGEWAGFLVQRSFSPNGYFRVVFGWVAISVWGFDLDLLHGRFGELEVETKALMQAAGEEIRKLDSRSSLLPRIDAWCED